MIDSVFLYPALFLSALIAGWIDSVAGGGGLVTIPVLLGVGLPPQLALGTNKFQASFGSFTAALYHVRKGVVPLRDAAPGIALTFIGAALGTWAVQKIDPGVLNVVVPFLLLASALYMLVSPIPGDTDRRARMPRLVFYTLAGLAFGFYDGFFGPGVGSFWAIAFVTGLGFRLTKATGYTKVMNFTSNIVSFFIFLAGGHVLFLAGASMAVGQIVGARIGSGLVVQRGARFIRPVFIAVVIATTLKLIYDRLT
jgi:hypothetical protein